MADRKTYEQHLVSINASTQGQFACPNCGKKVPAFALAEVLSTEDIRHEFACSMCIEDHARSLIVSTGPVLTWDDIRSLRTRLLSQCDWSQTLDVPEQTRNQWTAIRTDLRNITTTYTDMQAAYSALKKIEIDHFG